MNITQLQIAFNAEQDRLLFRISGADGNEMRAWLARRLVKQLWPKLQQLPSNKVAQEVPAATTDARRMVLGMRHEAAVGQADFSQPYRANATQFPLGEEPFVTSRLSMSAFANGSYLLAMHPADGCGVELRVAARLVPHVTKSLSRRGMGISTGFSRTGVGRRKSHHDADAELVVVPAW